MTVIVWDGKTLAADKQATNNGHASAVTKIHRIGESLIGFSGDACFARAMLQWAKNGFNPATFPAHQASEDDYVGFLLIEPGGRLLKYERTAYPIEIEEKTHAMGSGRDYALAALYLGKTAREAVEVACALDINCGKGIDTLEF